VIDVDGADGRAAAVRLGLFSEPTLAVLTGRGVHLYYHHPGFHVSNRPLAPHVDVRGDDGFVVVPPSIHPSGARYRWDKAPILPLPPEVRALLRNGNGAAAHAALLPTGAPIPEGQRATTLTSLAGTMRRRGMLPDEIGAALRTVNTNRCRPPLPDAQVDAIAASVGRYPAAENAGAPPRERDTAQAFDPPLLAAFAAAHTAPVEWEVPGYLGRDLATVFAGLPKVGKTTRVADWVGGIAARTPVLWIDLEQPRGLTAKVLTTHCAPSAPVYVCWGALPDLVQAATWCRDHGVGVVVVDSLSKVWRAFGVEDENDPVQVEQALHPLLTFARTAHVALLVLHHLRKSGGDEGLDFRGSGQIMAAFDIAVSFRRFSTNPEVEDPRRVLHSLSRFEETPRQLVVEYVDHRYRACGTPGEVRRRTERDALLVVLTAEPQTAEDLANASNLAASAARTVLRALVDQHLVERTGAGRKGDPFRYSKCLRAEESLYLRTSISAPTGEQERLPDRGDAYEPEVPR